MQSWTTTALAGAAIGALFLTAIPAGAQNGMQKWSQGKGWGWVWGPDDEVGALNEMTDASRLAALKLVTQGKVYDLGLLTIATPTSGPATARARSSASARPKAWRGRRTCRSPRRRAATPGIRAGTATRCS
jgi:hypothetical protein